MAYTPTTSEAQFVAQFEQNRPAIEAYKRAHGGDLEGAFRAVTGVPWPEGRSVKIDDGRPVMTKDRTVLSVLGKYVAPIAGAVAAPFVLPALAGAGGAAGAAGAAGATTTGITGPLAGLATYGPSGALLSAGTGAAAGIPNWLEKGARFANLAKGVMDTIGDVRGAPGGGDTGVIAANRADQAARNRYIESQLAQAGPGVDRAALGNVVRAGAVSGFQPSDLSTPYGTFGKRSPVLSEEARGFASNMQKELSRRMAAGEPLTLSGMMPKSPEELEDERRAQSATSSGNRFGQLSRGIESGVRLAKLGKGIWDLF